MARPAIGPRVVFFIDADELAALDARAKELHMKRGALIRHAVRLVLNSQLTLDDVLAGDRP